MSSTLSTRDVAEMFDVTSRAVRFWVSRDLLTSTRTPGGHNRFTQEDVERLKDAQLPGIEFPRKRSPRT